MRTERSGDELSKLDGEGLTEGIYLSINFPSLDLQRDEHRDDRGDQCDQSGEQSLPVIDEIDDGCVVPRHGDVVSLISVYATIRNVHHPPCSAQPDTVAVGSSSPRDEEIL